MLTYPVIISQYCHPCYTFRLLYLKTRTCYKQFSFYIYFVTSILILYHAKNHFHVFGWKIFFYLSLFGVYRRRVVECVSWIWEFSHSGKLHFFYEHKRIKDFYINSFYNRRLCFNEYYMTRGIDFLKKKTPFPESDDDAYVSFARFVEN